MNYFIKIFLGILIIIWLGAMYRAKFGQDALSKKTPNILVVGVTPEETTFNNDVAHAIAKRIGKKIVVKEMANEQLIPELLTHAVHAVIQKNNEPHEDILFSEPYTKEETLYYIAVAKNNDALLNLINNALIEIKEDGTLTELQSKEFLPA